VMPSTCSISWATWLGSRSLPPFDTLP